MEEREERPEEVKKELEALTRGRTDRFSTKSSIKHHKYLPLIICSFKFTSAFVWPGNVHYVAENVSSCECFFPNHDRALWHMTLANELDQDGATTNYHARCLGQRSFCSKVIVWTHADTQTHTQKTDCITRPLNRCVNIIILSSNTGYASVP